MNSEKINLLAQSLLDLPGNIQEKQVELLGLNEKISSLREEISHTEVSIKSEIAKETDINGKKIFSNDDARAAAFIQVTENNEELQEKKEELSTLQKNYSLLSLEIERLQNDQKNYRVLLDFFRS
jgi:predicted  nucleic acid-binding Zn-ribbon protein